MDDRIGQHRPDDVGRMDAKLDRIAEDVSDLKVRVGILEQQYASISNRIDRIETRLDRIGRRLDLVDAD